ncbi:MAG: TonB-dependent receptor [Acidobacteria bacterium]|nr:TonB-dependent receptor [Acidobacteriota bacterium]
MIRTLATFVFFSLSALVIIPATALAQGDGAIHGEVVAQADGSPVPGAVIQLTAAALPKSLETISAEDGHFGFQRLVPGDYELTVSHENFQSARYQLVLKPREVQNLTLSLALRTVEEMIEVHAEAVSISPTYSPSSTALQEQSLQQLPLTQRTSLPEAIVIAAPGMIRSHDDFVHVRGSEVALNTFINGVSFWENPHAMFSSGLSPDVIQSVNVMTGGFPAEFGNRFGGILDITTRSGFTMNNEGALTFGLGTALRHNAAVEYGGHSEKAAYFLYSSGFESARFLSPPDPRSIHDTGRGARSFLQLDFTLNSSNYLKLLLMADGANFEIPKTAQDDQLRPDTNRFQRTRSQSAVFNWGHIISKDALLNLSFYQRWSRSLLLPSNDRLAAITRSERTLDTLGIKSDLTRFVGKHTIKGGLDLVLLRPEERLFYNHRGWMRYTNLLGIPHQMIDLDFAQKKTGGQISLYAQDTVQLTSSLSVNAGLRYDRYSLAVSDFHFSPRLNVAYRFSSGTVLHGSYNHFFVPPPVENVLASSAGLTSLLRGYNLPLPPLQPTTENQFELGVSHQLPYRLKVGLTGYYRISNNQVHTVLLPDSRVYLYANFDKAKAYGLEMKAAMPEIARLGLSGYFNYALSRVYLFNPVGAGFITDTSHLSESGRFLAPMDQTHTVSSALTYRHHPTRLWTSMAFEYGSGTPLGHGAGHTHDAGGADQADSMTGSGPERVPQHFTQNLSIGWEAIPNGEQPRLSLQFNIENLTNNVYIVAQESEFTPGQYFIPRMYSASIKLHF